jgi:predicted aspartyl protease
MASPLRALVIVVALFFVCLATVYGADLTKATQLFTAKNYPAAVAELNNLLKTGNPTQAESARIYYLLGCCYYSSNRPDDAEKLFDSVIGSYPASEEAKLSQQMLTRMGKLVPAKTSAVAPSKDQVPETLKTQEDALALAKKMMEKMMAGEDISKMAKPSNAKYVFNDEGGYEPDSPHDRLPEQTRIYYEPTNDGHMVVNGWVNNRPMRMWFDTGATAHFGKNDLAAAGIPLPQGKPDGYTTGWAGTIVPIWHMYADVRIGDVSRRLPISVEENSTLPPLIGTDFTRGYEVEIDRAGKRLNLKRNKPGGDTSKLDSLYDLPCTTSGHDVFLKMTVNKRQCDVFIDTGASNTIINAATADRLGIEIPPDAPSMMFTGVGGGTRMRQVPLDVTLGPITRHDFPVFIGGKAGNCIGQDLMSGWRFKVDRDRHLVRFFH